MNFNNCYFHSVSAAQSPTTLGSKLKALQCHFAWDLDLSHKQLFRLTDHLENIGTDEGNFWLGHIYNLRGFVQFKMGFTEDARSLFNQALEAFTHPRAVDSNEGPWLVVNYGNLAWLHHHLGEQAKCQAYLSKVDVLIEKHPPPSEDELHPEVYAEKAWTLMKFRTQKQQMTKLCFEKAVGMRPDMVEWNTSHVLWLERIFSDINRGLQPELLEKMRIARRQDPHNLYLAFRYLDQCARKGEKVEDEARELANRVMRNPTSSYSGMKTLLWVYIKYVSIDEAIDLAEKALEKYPDQYYVKCCAALCYKWSIMSREVPKSQPKTHIRDKAIHLHEEMISLYPRSSLLRKTDLAYIYATYDMAKAEQIYQELLDSDQEPADKQMIYSRYAGVLFIRQNSHHESIKYHMKVLEIPQQSYFRENSFRILQREKEKFPDLRHKIEELLQNVGSAE